jgi:hypothetical protein
MEDNSGNIGEIESSSNRANLQKRWTAEAQNRLDALIAEARSLNATKEGLSFERLMIQLNEADKILSLSSYRLPGGYKIVRDARSKHGIYLRKGNGKIDPQEFAMDLSAGWIDSINALIEGLLDERRPKMITAKEE